MNFLRTCIEPRPPPTPDACSSPLLSADHATDHLEWRPAGRGETLHFGSADEPVASEEEPRLLQFVQPVLEDETHRHAFYFESDTARREAMRILGVAV